MFSIRVQEQLIKTVQRQLEITDEAIITSSHEAYQNRKDLYEYMNDEVLKKQK